MSKLELPAGQDNVIVRNQEVYGFLPKDVIDRLGDTSTQLATEDQTALGAINELKSNLTYKDGEEYKITTPCYIFGMTGSTGIAVVGTLYTPKIIPNDYTVTISGSINNIRSTSSAVTSGITITSVNITGDNTLTFICSFSTSIGNNQLCNIVPNSLTLTFHAPT